MIIRFQSLASRRNQLVFEFVSLKLVHSARIKKLLTFQLRFVKLLGELSN